jgi:hypothetical protein
MEITNGKAFQNSVLWRAAKCHCQLADLQRHIFDRFKASNTLLNSTKYTIKRKEKISLLSKNLVWTKQQ